MKFCVRCNNGWWVCERYPSRPFFDDRACDWGGAGAPCPVFVSGCSTVRARCLATGVPFQLISIKGRYRPAVITVTDFVSALRGPGMKHLCEFMSEGWAAAAAALWFVSASIRLKRPNRLRHGLESGFDDPRAVLMMVYRQSRWSAWAAIAAGLAAVFAIADGLLPGTQ
jgi:hypothetical protein